MQQDHSEIPVYEEERLQLTGSEQQDFECMHDKRHTILNTPLLPIEYTYSFTRFPLQLRHLFLAKSYVIKMKKSSFLLSILSIFQIFNNFT